MVKFLDPQKIEKPVEASVWEDYDGYFDYEEISFLFKRFQRLAKSNKVLFGRSSNFKGLCSKNREDDQNICYNCNKPYHFWNDCPNIQRTNHLRETFWRKVSEQVQECLMETWDELNNEKDSDKEAEEANLELMVLTLSNSESESEYGSESDEEDKVYSNVSCSDLIHDFMSLFQD